MSREEEKKKRQQRRRFLQSPLVFKLMALVVASVINSVVFLANVSFVVLELIEHNVHFVVRITLFAYVCSYVQ